MRIIARCLVFGGVFIPFAKDEETEITESYFEKLNERNAKKKKGKERTLFCLMKDGRFCMKEVFIFIPFAHGAVRGL